MQDIAIVTGGAQGIGLACAKRLSEKGVHRFSGILTKPLWRRRLPRLAQPQ